MARIKRTDIYPIKTNPHIKDFVVGSEYKRGGKTVSFEIGNLLSNSFGGMSDGFISGDYSWIEGTLSFYITELIYRKNDKLYATVPTTITLDSGGSLPRKDIIAVTTGEEVVVIKGQESAIPAEPVLPNTTEYLRFTVVDIAAGATIPDGLQVYTIFDEGSGQPSEWSASENTGGTRIILPSQDDSNTFLKSIKIIDPNLTGDVITFSKGSVNTAKLTDKIQMFVKLTSEVGLNQGFKVSLYNGTTKSTDDLLVIDGLYNFDAGIVDDWQLVSINFGNFVFNSIDYDNLKLELIGFDNSLKTFYIDTIVLVEGFPVVETGTTHSSLTLDDGSNPHGTTKGDVGLGNADNTSDLDKPISTATALALGGKVDNSRVLTDVPAGALFTDTIYTLPFADNSSNWNAAYSWGNHALVGYLTSFTESDPTVPAYAKTLSSFNIIKSAADVIYEPLFTKNTAFNKNFSTTAIDIKVNGTQSLGALDTIARADHVHPTDTSRAATNQTMYIGTTAVAINRASGTLNLTGLGTVAGTSFNSITGLATVAPLIAGTAAVGTSTLAARQDHKHPTDTTRQAALNGTGFVKISGTTISYDNSTYAYASSLSNYLPLAGGTMANTNVVTNLNADLLRGVHWGNVNTKIQTSGESQGSKLTAVGTLTSGSWSGYFKEDGSNPDFGTRIRLVEPEKATNGLVLSAEAFNGTFSYAFGTKDNVDIEFYTNGVERLRIKGDGSVGIGTTSTFGKFSNVPNNTLSSRGHGVSSSSIVWVIGDYGYSTAIENTINAGLGHGLLIKTANIGSDTSVADFESGGVNRFTVRANGYIGVNNPSPSYNLDVSGTGRFTENVVFGDYSQSSQRILDLRTNKAVLLINADGVTNGIGSTITYGWANGGQGSLKFNNSAGTVFTLDPSGAATFTYDVTATNFILSSDRVLKTKIKDFNNSSINVNWKEYEFKSNKGQKRYGVIAQELEVNHPEFVRTDEDGVKSVAYIDLLVAKIAELESRLSKLEK